LRSLAELTTAYLLSPVAFLRDAAGIGTLKDFTVQPTEEARQELTSDVRIEEDEGSS
jgi:hypothetical protein